MGAGQGVGHHVEAYSVALTTLPLDAAEGFLPGYIKPLVRELTAEAHDAVGSEGSTDSRAAEAGGGSMFDRFVSWLRGSPVAVTSNANAQTWLPPHAAFPCHDRLDGDLKRLAAGNQQADQPLYAEMPQIKSDDWQEVEGLLGSHEEVEEEQKGDTSKPSSPHPHLMLTSSSHTPHILLTNAH